MTFKRILAFLYLACLCVLSLEILVRRWWLDQSPTQITSGFVYAVLLLNGWVILLQLKRLRRRAG